MEIDFTKTIIEINKADKIGLVTHLLGDGDAFGSLLGLRNILEKLDKKVVIFSNETLGKQIDFLSDNANYDPIDEYIPINLLITLDTANLSRLTCPNVFSKALKSGTKTLIIDHHAEGDIYDLADIVLSNTEISSTSEIVFWLSQEMGMRLDRETAEYLLIGIETDTNFLKNPNSVNKTTFTAKAELLKYGARAKKIIEKLNETNSINNLKFTGSIVKRAQLSKKYGILSTYITSDDQKEYNIDPGSSSAICNFLDQARNAKVVLVAEQRDNIIKVSMRSNNSNVNVAQLASFFGGGGHVKAAGFDFIGNLNDIIESIKV